MKQRSEKRYGMEQKPYQPKRPPIDLIIFVICLIGFAITVATMLGEL
jgi:hypothetical protein